ncbi:unnamed protein product, partial [Polarella glacialis]
LATKREELRLSLEASAECKAQLATGKEQNVQLRQLVLEMLDEASRWRRQAEDPWAARVQAVLQEASATGLAFDHSEPLRQTPSNDDKAMAGALQGIVGERQSRAALEEREATRELQLRAEIQLLREESQQLGKALQEGNCPAGPAPASGAARAGSTAAKLEGARRRVLTCSRKVRFLQTANAKLRVEVRKAEDYQQKLQGALLAQSQDHTIASSSFSSVNLEALRQMSVQAAARQLVFRMAPPPRVLGAE